MKRTMFAFGSAAAGMILGGCVSVLPEMGPAAQIYRLDGAGGAAKSAEALAAGPTELTFLVPEPLAPRALATDRIAVSVNGDHISYAAGARWSERAPRVVQDRVLSAFEDDTRVRAAVRPEDAVESRYEVRLELRAFEAVYRDGAAAPPTAVVSLRAKLVDRDTRELLASTRVDSEQAAAANRMGDIIAAFDAAMDDAGQRVVAWSLAGAGAQPSASAASSSR